MNRRSLLVGALLAACTTWPATWTRRAGASAAHFRPLYPLGIVVFPGERVLLEVFETRYRQLVADSQRERSSFGIVTVVPGGVSNVGTEMRVERVIHWAVDENMRIEARGLRVFALERFQGEIAGKSYSGGFVTFHKNDSTIEPEMQAALVQLYNRLQYIAGNRKRLSPPFPENLSFIIGHDVGLSRAEELRLIAMPSERDRQALLFQHLLSRM